MPNPENIAGQGFHTDPDRINKEGRPKGSRNLSSILREMLQEEIEVNIDGVKSKKQFQEVIIRKLLKKANDGDIRAIMEIFDRVEGKPKQEIDFGIESRKRVADLFTTDEQEDKKSES